MCLVACSSTSAEQTTLRDQGIALIESGDYQGAIDSFNEALSLSMGHVGSLEIDIDYYKAAAQYKAGLTEDAIATYTALIVYDEGAYEPHFLRGSIYADTGDIDMAVADYDAALALDDKNYLLYIQIYENLTALGYGDQAAAYLNKALEVSDKSAESSYYKGRIYYLLGDYDSATEYLQNAIDKNIPEASLYMAKIYQAQGDNATAQSLLEQYASSDDVTSEALATLGDIELAAGNYENALSYYETGEGLEVVTNESQLLKGHVVALENLGRFDEAKEVLTQYLEAYPDDADAQKELIFLQTR